MAWAVVIIALLGAGTGLFGASQVDSDDDILAFLPRDNPDVTAFYEINERFGGLDVAVVGIETPYPFDPNFLKRLEEATQILDDTPAIESALSIANVQDFKSAEGGGIDTGLLISKPAWDDASKAALRDKVMSRDMIVGNLISTSGDAVILYAFASFGADPKTFADTVRRVVEARFPGETVYWGGAPFISTYIYTATQDDLRRLTPWAVIVIIILIVLAFRDPVGAGLALLSTGMGIAMSMGLMGILGVRYNIVLSSMPVILFAVGSAYAIHVLAHYYAEARDTPPTEAMVETLTNVGPTVFAAGMTTVAGLLSFLAMDIAPLRTFGVFTALGIFATLVLALTFVPAVIVLLGLGGKEIALPGFTARLVTVVSAAHARRRVVGAGLVIVAAVGIAFAGRVDTRMDQTSFFAEGSPPDLADQFLIRHFGGSMFIQVSLEGDFADPDVLREIEKLADEIAMIDRVSSVQHVGQVLAQLNQAMAGSRRIPDDAAQTKLLYTFLAGNEAVKQLVTDDRTQALLHIKVASSTAEDVELVLHRVERLVANQVPSRFSIVPATEPKGVDVSIAHAVGRVRALCKASGVEPPAAGQVNEILRAPVEAAAARPIAAILGRFLLSDEAIVELEPDVAHAVAAAVASVGPQAEPEAVDGAVAAALQLIEPEGEDAEMLDDLIMSIETPLADAWRLQRARARAELLITSVDLVLPEGAPGDRLRSRIIDELGGLEAPTALLAATDGSGTLGAQVSGLPVLHRGLSRSVARNQLLSLGLALSLVLVILSLLFRSLWGGLLATAPTLLTLAVIYGGMGYLGVSLDIGTSMLASMIIGAGVDYAVHLVSAWHVAEGGPLERAAAVAAERTGPAIWTNALMVAAGFFVLTLGEAKTLQNVGGLTSAAMIAAAVATFLTVPVLARRHNYRRSVAVTESGDEALAEG